MKLKLVLFCCIFLAIVSSCEKDDICLAETVGTPHLIIRFYDASNTSNTKPVTNLRIVGVGNNDEFGAVATTDSIAIPLKILDTTTEYILTSDYAVDDNGTPDDTSDDIITGNEDQITINYTNEEVFISRACGFKNTFTNLGFDFTNDGDNWILNYTVENNIVENESNAHVYIYH